jgi:biopolymer transport protein ExbB
MDINQIKELVDYGTLAVLGVMGFIALLFSFERVFTYRGIDPKAFDSKKRLEIVLSKNLTAIATIGSNAPYVGLLGTVGGIMITFYGIGQEGLSETGQIMIGLALALKATALGLVVAIPSMIFYNLLVRRAEVLESEWDILKEESGETKEV